MTKTDHVFTPSEISLLIGIGGELGSALRNAKLYEQTRRQAEEMAALLAVGQAGTSSLDLQQTLETALSQALAVTGAEAGEIWLVDRSGEVALRARRGDSQRPSWSGHVSGGGRGFPA
ncbi:MAG: GAF domain-containing protein [Chloroflexi bacterium]|nr:GAF domain-containing protein [Chloroflexota bacterium]